MEIAKTLLVPTSPRKPDRGGHRASEVSTDRRRRPSNIEYSAQADLPQVRKSGEATSKLGSAKKMEPSSCLDLTCGSGEHTCDGRSCVRIQSFQKEDLVIWFEDITEREKSEVQIVAECYANTTVNIATVLGFYSRMCRLQSLRG